MLVLFLYMDETPLIWLPGWGNQLTRFVGEIPLFVKPKFALIWNQRVNTLVLKILLVLMLYNLVLDYILHATCYQGNTLGNTWAGKSQDPNSMGTNRLWTTIHSYQEIFNCRTCSNVSRTSFTLVWSSLQATGFVCICGNRMDTKLVGNLKSMKIQVLLIKLASSCMPPTDGSEKYFNSINYSYAIYRYCHFEHFCCDKEFFRIY